MELIGVLLYSSIHRVAFLPASAEISSNLKVSIGIWIGGQHLQEDSGCNAVAGFAILLFQVNAHDMDWVPCTYLHCATLKGLLDEEAAAKTSHIGVEKVHRCEGVIHVEVMMNIALENVVEFLLQL